jgi:hypothetical protein
MKNSQKGFVVPLLVTIIALLVLGEGYWYMNNKTKMVPDAKVQEEQKEVVGEGRLTESVLVKNSNSTNTPNNASTEQIIIQKSDKIISLLKNTSISSLKGFIHPTKGVRISKDGYIDKQRDVILKASEIDSLIKNGTKLSWGYSDGKGDAINLSAEEYFSRYLSIDFSNSQKKYNQAVRGGSNTTLDIQGVYINNNFVNYYIPYNSTYVDEGVVKPQTMDWRAINLVFEEYNGESYLIGIITDNWTI